MLKLTATYLSDNYGFDEIYFFWLYISVYAVKLDSNFTFSKIVCIEFMCIQSIEPFDLC